MVWTCWLYLNTQCVAKTKTGQGEGCTANGSILSDAVTGGVEGAFTLSRIKRLN